MTHYTLASAVSPLSALVVIAIIAILAAILSPSSPGAREARQTSCLSICDRHGVGHTPRTTTIACISHYFTPTGPSNTPGTTPSAGTRAPPTWAYQALHPQLSDQPVPSFRAQTWGRLTPHAYTCIGGDVFAWPATMPVSVGAIVAPVDTALFADSAYWTAEPSPGLAGNNYLRAPGDPSYAYVGPNVHFRHNRVANVTWADGHAKAATRAFNVSAEDDQLGDLSLGDERATFAS